MGNFVWMVIILAIVEIAIKANWFRMGKWPRVTYTTPREALWNIIGHAVVILLGLMTLW